MSRSDAKSHSPESEGIRRDESESDALDPFLSAALEEAEPSSRAPGALTGLAPGDVLGGRFVIERRAARGGMGTVYRARDAATSELVAIKVLERSRSADSARFVREIALLAELRHPAIVRYVGHGQTPRARPFLAMQWLDGEDLATRLARSRLTIPDSLALARRVASALGTAHARGVVHRDIKPSNLFLVGGDPSAVSLLDFGIARWAQNTRTVTNSGTVLGSVGYMAPEQALGAPDIDARADVFSLGCVLFECLTGQSAFAGRHAVGVLAKVLCDEPPPVTRFRPEAGPAIDALLATLLAKDRERRPSDGWAALAALREVGAGSAASAPGTLSLTSTEQRIVSVVLGRSRSVEPRHDSAVDVVNELESRTGSASRLLWLRDGSVLAVYAERAAASDQAVRAAMLALRLQRERSDLALAVATGRAETTGAMPVGAAIDRAAELLQSRALCGAAITIDELSATLLGSRFEVQTTASGLELLGCRDELDAPRMLMGRPTPCFGRDKELALLAATLEECLLERVARSVIVTAPPGIGKSRLASEFLERVPERASLRVLVARADPMTAGAALALVQKLIRAACSVRELDEPRRQRRDLRAHLEQLVPADAAHLELFLSEALAVGDPGETSPLLRSARHDPAIMQEQGLRAFQALLAAEVARQPVVLVLEDLHWGDAVSVGYIARTLRRLERQPVMLLALGRVDVRRQFPALWDDASASHLQLAPLTPSSAERLLRAQLPNADAATVARLLHVAEGNAFYLEELVRHVVDGARGLPDTVLAMAESRLERLEPEARRVLRAASVFGEQCWRAGIELLLGQSTDVGEWLEVLVSREILRRSGTSRFPSERQYVFRHALLRDAAYAMLTNDDRRLAHELAGRWLESVGERDANLFVRHYTLANDASRALPWLVRAAQTAMHGGDLSGATELARQGLAELAASGHERGVLLVVRAYTAAWEGRSEIDELPLALELLPSGSAYWWVAISVLIWAAAASGRPERAAPFLQLALAEAPAGPELNGPYGQAVQALVAAMTLMGRGAEAWAFLEQFAGVSGDDPDCDPVFLSWLNAARCQLLGTYPCEGSWNIEEAIHLGRRSAGAMVEVGSKTGAATALMYWGIAALNCGLYDEAEDAVRRGIELAKRTGNRFLEECLLVLTALLHTRRGDFAGALAIAEPLHDSLDANVVQVARVASSEAHYRAGRHDAAERDAELALHGASPATARWACALLARVQLSRARPELALELVERRAGELVPVAPESEAELGLVRGLALRALGRDAAAIVAFAAARTFVLGTAERIRDPGLRHAYLTRVRVNVDILEFTSGVEGSGHD